jgi:hypothetical protein
VSRICPKKPVERAPIGRKLGPAWTERGRPQDGYLTKRLAECELR